MTFHTPIVLSIEQIYAERDRKIDEAKADFWKRRAPNMPFDDWRKLSLAAQWAIEDIRKQYDELAYRRERQVLAR